jgi:hypothetical protein
LSCRRTGVRNMFHAKKKEKTTKDKESADESEGGPGRLNIPCSGGGCPWQDHPPLWPLRGHHRGRYWRAMPSLG